MDSSSHKTGMAPRCSPMRSLRHPLRPADRPPCGVEDERVRLAALATTTATDRRRAVARCTGRVSTGATTGAGRAPAIAAVRGALPAAQAILSGRYGTGFDAAVADCHAGVRADPELGIPDAARLAKRDRLSGRLQGAPSPPRRQHRRGHRT